VLNPCAFGTTSIFNTRPYLVLSFHSTRERQPLLNLHRSLWPLTWVLFVEALIGLLCTILKLRTFDLTFVCVTVMIFIFSLLFLLCTRSSFTWEGVRGWSTKFLSLCKCVMMFSPLVFAFISPSLSSERVLFLTLSYPPSCSFS